MKNPETHTQHLNLAALFVASDPSPSEAGSSEPETNTQVPCSFIGIVLLYLCVNFFWGSRIEVIFIAMCLEHFDSMLDS